LALAERDRTEGDRRTCFDRFGLDRDACSLGGGNTARNDDGNVVPKLYELSEFAKKTRLRKNEHSYGAFLLSLAITIRILELRSGLGSRLSTQARDRTEGRCRHWRKIPRAEPSRERTTERTGRRSWSAPIRSQGRGARRIR